jgi:glycosyltransferase involved in cell wall biosynthesis
LNPEPFSPIVSVVMPAYNCAPYIKEAVESVCRQTLTQWELIILDDCSTDDTLAIARSVDDPRIRVVESPRNRGQAYQMNKGISLAKGQFVAIAHSDDINEPDRLESQLDFLQKNSSAGVVGSWIQYFGDRTGIEKYPAGSADCFVMLLDDSPFAHPAVLFRKSVLDGLAVHYRQEFVPAEDYELWARLSAVTKFDNVSRPLVNYRVHGHQISKQRKAELQEKIKKIRALFLDENFRAMDPALRASLDSLLTLEKGSFISRSRMKQLGPLSAELARISGIDEAIWKKRLSRILWIALTVTTDYQWGTGLLFLARYPAFLRELPDYTVRIAWRSLNPRKTSAK